VVWDGSRSKHHGYTGFSGADGAGAALLAAGGAIVGESEGIPALPDVARLQPQGASAQRTKRSALAAGDRFGPLTDRSSIEREPTLLGPPRGSVVKCSEIVTFR
jgi:hypothetical protein